jgi:putative copper resistance protein D
MAHVEFSLHNALTQWQFSAFPVSVVIVLVAIAVWYLRADWRLAARGRRWSGTRTASFMCGLMAIDLALQSPVAAMTGTYFQAHVVQHLLLMVVGPPLLALGAPSTLLLQTSSRRTKQLWLRVLRSSPFAVVSHPVVVWCLYYGVMFAFFLTFLLNFAMLHMWVMDFINVGFLFGATLFWWPMVGIDPIIHWKMGYPARMLNILLGSGVEAFLGVAILNSDKPLASMYTLGSTKAGGGLLWAATEVVTLGAFVPIFVQWMRSEERVAVRADQRGGTSMSIVSSPGDDMLGGGRGYAGSPGSALANGAGGAGGRNGSDRSGAAPDMGVNGRMALNGRAGSGAPGSDGSNGSNGSAGTLRAPAAGGVRGVPVDTSKLTAWEYAWLVRTGSVPTRFVVPDHAPGPEDVGDIEDVDEGSS